MKTNLKMYKDTLILQRKESAFIQAVYIPSSMATSILHDLTTLNCMQQLGVDPASEGSRELQRELNRLYTEKAKLLDTLSETEHKLAVESNRLAKLIDDMKTGKEL